MLILVQNHERQWRVVHPLRTESVFFRDGCMAFDFADALAREHHAETGQVCGVRVEANDHFVDAVQYGQVESATAVAMTQDMAEGHALPLPIQPVLG